MVSACGAISQQAGRVVSPGSPSGPRPTLIPLLPRSPWRAHKIVARPLLDLHPSFCFHCLTSVDSAEEKGYEHLPPLDESVAADICPPMAIGWKARVSQPSKPCRATSALAGRAYLAAGQAASPLHSMTVLQVFQAKWGSRSGCSFTRRPEKHDRPSSTLPATKATTIQGTFKPSGFGCPVW